MGNANNQLKELVNEAIHNHFHDYTETEMILKDWLYGICEQLDEYEKSKHRTHVNDCKAEAFDAILKSYDEAFSREHMADDVSNIIEKYESGEYDAKK